MRATLLIALILMALSCEKQTSSEVITIDLAIGISPRKTVYFLKPGMWNGKIWYSIPDVVTQEVNAYRQIRYLSDSIFTVQWFSNPDTTDTVKVSDTISYTMALYSHNTSCGDQETYFIYQSKGFIRNDTLYESGAVEYRWLYYGELRKQRFGTWHSWSVWEREIHY